MSIKNTSKLKLGIVGHGFVGKATDLGFSKNLDKYIVDPVYNTSIEGLRHFSPDLIFICVPTPLKDNNLEPDLNYVMTAALEISEP